MAKRPQHVDHLLRGWPYTFGEVSARIVPGGDGREVIQLRIDMGLLQMETTGRPDGDEPDGFPTYYDYLLSVAFQDGKAFELCDERCMEIDREFVQFYHRRVAWLALREFRRAVLDADHTLGLMDFSSAHAPDEEWADMHEQYRPFVIFHRTQAAALAEIDDMNPEGAVDVIEVGLRQLRDVFVRHDLEEEYEDDELVEKLIEMRDAMAEYYELEGPLDEQLAEAIASEQYELAAELRDRMNRRPRRKM